jgi:hypothetical protein
MSPIIPILQSLIDIAVWPLWVVVIVCIYAATRELWRSSTK